MIMKKRIINISSSEYEELIKTPPLKRYIKLVEYPSTTFFVEKIMPSKKWGACSHNIGENSNRNYWTFPRRKRSILQRESRVA